MIAATLRAAARQASNQCGCSAHGTARNSMQGSDVNFELRGSCDKSRR
jgi:hypothetical protein